MDSKMMRLVCGALAILFGAVIYFRRRRNAE
jgi:hypothetical protein